MKRSKRAALAAAACISALVMAGLPGVPAPAAAQTSAPTTSAPAPTVPASKPARDGSGAPDPSTSPTTAVPYEPPASATAKGFDEKLSKVVAAETTPTKLVYDNPDGTSTARIDIAPVRFRDSTGKWVDYDLSLVARPDGRLGAKAAPDAPTLSRTAQGAVATVQTKAGPVVLRHPGAAPSAAVLDGGEATYPDALSGGRDLKIHLSADGFEESVVLPDAAAGGSYLDELVLPEDVTVRQVPAGIEVLDRTGAVISTFGGGFAFDAAIPQAALPTPVSVTLVSQVANVATLEVAIADRAWLSAPERTFPATIDPAWAQLTTQPGGYSTSVGNGAAYINAPGSSYTTHAVGLYPSVGVFRTLLDFDVTSLPNVTVISAQINMFNTFTGFSNADCTAKAVHPYTLSGPFTANTTWNTKPGTTAATPIPSSFARQPAAGSQCASGWVGVLMTSIVQGWVNTPSSNYGVELRADETQTSAFQQFYSPNAYGGAYPPYLYVTWDRPPNPPTNVVATANADGTATATWTLAPANDGSAIDSYLVYALNPDLSIVTSTTVCATCTTATFTNLARSKAYVLSVHAHKAGGMYSVPARSAQITTPADALVRAGDGPLFSYDTFALSDRMGAKVNLGTGNLEVATTDMAIPAVGGARVLGRTYNSFALAPASTAKISPLFGPAWRFSEAPDRRLLVNYDTSVTYLSASGNATVFAAGTLAAPTGTDALMVKNGDGTYKLTDPGSATVMNFRADGLMTSEVDRNGNTITFTYPGGGGYGTSIAGNAGTAPGNTATIAYGGPGAKVSALSKTDGTTTIAVGYT